MALADRSRQRFGSRDQVSFWITLPAAGLAYAALAARRYAIADADGRGCRRPRLVEHVRADADRVDCTSRNGRTGRFRIGERAGAVFLRTERPDFSPSAALTRRSPSCAGMRSGAAGSVSRNSSTAWRFSGMIPAPLIIFATLSASSPAASERWRSRLGIFLPAFAFALLFYDRLERVIEDERLHRFLEASLRALSASLRSPPCSSDGTWRRPYRRRSQALRFSPPR